MVGNKYLQYPSMVSNMRSQAAAIGICIFPAGLLRNIYFILQKILDSLHGTLAEWLRRSPAKAVRNACESSNLSGVETFLLHKFSCFVSCLFYCSEKIERYGYNKVTYVH